MDISYAIFDLRGTKTQRILYLRYWVILPLSKGANYELFKNPYQHIEYAKIRLA